MWEMKQDRENKIGKTETASPSEGHTVADKARTVQKNRSDLLVMRSPHAGNALLGVEGFHSVPVLSVNSIRVEQSTNEWGWCEEWARRG